VENEYDLVGNVSRFKDHGDAEPDDDVEATVEYSNCPSYVVGQPTHIVVQSNGTTLRERFAEVDCTTGDVTKIRELIGPGVEAVTDLEYDTNGMLTKVIGPANLHNERYSLSYEYDPVVGAHITKVTDDFQLSSGADYDLRFGLPRNTTDANGSKV